MIFTLKNFKHRPSGHNATSRERGRKRERQSCDSLHGDFAGQRGGVLEIVLDERNFSRIAVGSLEVTVQQQIGAIGRGQLAVHLDVQVRNLALQSNLQLAYGPVKRIQ